MTESVLVTSSRALVLACEEMSVDTDSMLQSVGVARETIEDPDARLPLEQARALWAKAYELSGDPDLSLHAAERLPFGAYKVIDYMVQQAPTVGGGIARISDYFPLINSAVRLPIEVGTHRVTFDVVCPDAPGVLTRPYTEYIFAAVILRSRVASGIDYPLERIEFTHPAPESTAEHERVFGCEVRFGAEACRAVIDRGVWDSPAPSADSALLALLEEHATLLLKESPRPAGIVNDIRKTIASEFGGGDPSVQHVAKKLAMSPRTLQRRLTEEGVKYSEVLDDMRQGAAKAYLSQPDISITEAAYLLGFAEVSSLNRAFKRWLGCSPRQYRQGAPAATA